MSYEASQKSFLYFIATLNSKLDTDIRNSRINKHILEKAINLYSEIFLNPSQFHIIVKEDQTGLSFILNIIESYHLLFHSKEQIIITDNTGNNLMDNLIQSLNLVSLSYSMPHLDLSVNKVKNELTLKNVFNEKSKLIKESPIFEMNKFRGKNFDFMIFDNWTLKNISKISESVAEIIKTERTKKLIMVLSETSMLNLVKYLDSSIIVNKINFK